MLTYMTTLIANKKTYHDKVKKRIECVVSERNEPRKCATLLVLLGFSKSTSSISLIQLFAVVVASGYNLFGASNKSLPKKQKSATVIALSN
mgnify:CR=1 FL=1